MSRQTSGQRWDLPVEAGATLGQAPGMLAWPLGLSAALLLLGWTLYYDFTRTPIPPGISQGAKLRLIDWGLKVSISLVKSRGRALLGWALRLPRGIPADGLQATVAGVYDRWPWVQTLVLEKLGICRQYVVWRIVADGIPPGRDPDLTIKELLFDGVPVRVYWPKGVGAEPRRGLVWMHGGVGLFGSTRAHERMCRFVARESPTVVVCIEYPLAPEHPYPAQQLSCYAAVVHFLKNAGGYGVDPQRVVLAGDSSGGTLVAAIAQQLVMRTDLPPARAHVLLYPFLQALDFNLPSYQQHQSCPVLTKKLAISLALHYLMGTDIRVEEVMGNAHVPRELTAKYQKWISAERIPEEFRVSGYEPFVPRPFSEDLYQMWKKALEPELSPLLAEDDLVRQFPETFLLTCEYDIFRDDGLLYKRRLEENGVPVTWHHLEDGFHGICLLIGLGALEFPSTRKGMKSLVQFLDRF